MGRGRFVRWWYPKRPWWVRWRCLPYLRGFLAVGVSFVCSRSVELRFQLWLSTNKHLRDGATSGMPGGLPIQCGDCSHNSPMMLGEVLQKGNIEKGDCNIGAIGWTFAGSATDVFREN